MPSTGALFGNTATRNQNKNLVEFKAGKMTMKGKMVHPDKRKGLLYVYQSDDSLMHFCWKDRVTGVVEDDLIIFPDDCEFKKVEQCTTGRVYVLKFKSSSRKFFFWIQEPKTDKDEENCKKIIEMLNNPPAAGAGRSGHNPEADLQNLLGSMTQHQLMQLFGTFGTGGAGGLSNLLSTMSRPAQERTPTIANNAATTAASASSTTTSSDSSVRVLATTTAPASGSTTTTTSRNNAGGLSNNQPIQLSDLQKYLSNLTQSPEAHVPATPNVDLSDALNSESIAGVLNDPNLIRELSPHLPNIGGNESTEQQLRSTITSPQFQQAVSMFSAALQSGHLGPVVQQFQVGENAVNAAREGNMEEFVKALQNTSLNQDKNEEEGPKQPEKKKKTEDHKKDDNKKDEKKDDDEMALG